MGLNINSNFKPKVGIYIDNFKQFKAEHLDIIKQAQKLFWRVVVLSTEDVKLPEKFLNEENAYVDYYSDSLLNYLEFIEKEYGWDLTLIRNVKNLDQERKLYLTYIRLNPNIKIVYLINNPLVETVDLEFFSEIREKIHYPLTN